jgi:hypothetical protein
LNSYFASVFTHEDTENISTAKRIFPGKEINKLCDLSITEEGVRKRLSIKAGQGRRTRGDRAKGDERTIK